ncbi:MAG: PP2C family serine/threonine-protein phosphatase [Methanobacteriota archaeon]
MSRKSIPNLSGDNSGQIVVTGACIQGERHAKTGQPCQDAFFWSLIPDHGVVIAIADGLSSVTHAETGARIAVETACQAVISVYNTQTVPEDQKVLMKDAFTKAHAAVISEADSAGLNPAHYGSTLITAIFCNGNLTVGHIGDGIVAGMRGGKTLIISEPGQSEYANETNCLVQSDWDTQLRIRESSHIEAVILATDGCQGAVATRQLGNLQPYDPFLLPLVSFIRKRTLNGQDPVSDITGLLTLTRMLELSGDDKTLVILLGPVPAS